MGMAWSQDTDPGNWKDHSLTVSATLGLTVASCMFRIKNDFGVVDALQVILKLRRCLWAFYGGCEL